MTDDWDRRLVNVYIGTYFCPPAVDDPKFRLSELSEYVMPGESVDLDGLKGFVRSLPQVRAFAAPAAAERSGGSGHLDLHCAAWPLAASRGWGWGGG